MRPRPRAWCCTWRGALPWRSWCARGPGEWRRVASAPGRHESASGSRSRLARPGPCESSSAGPSLGLVDRISRPGTAVEGSIPCILARAVDGSTRGRRWPRVLGPAVRAGPPGRSLLRGPHARVLVPARRQGGAFRPGRVDLHGLDAGQRWPSPQKSPSQVPEAEVRGEVGGEPSASSWALLAWLPGPSRFARGEARGEGLCLKPGAAGARPGAGTPTQAENFEGTKEKPLASKDKRLEIRGARVEVA